MTANLLADLNPGNYHAKILINSQEYKRTGVVYEPFFANVTKQASRSQPVIVHLSQPSMLIAGGCNYYQETTEISRAQEIVSSIWFTGEKEDTQVRLKLVSLETKKEYLLTTSAPRFSGLCNTVRFCTAK